MRRAFGKAIMELGEAHPELVLVTGDVEQEMSAFKAKWPVRFFNFGTCEQSIMSICGGMACEGLRPVFYSITPFVLERPFEQIKIDIDEQNLPVLLIGYSDYPHHGPTHTPLNVNRLTMCFKNMCCFFPVDQDSAYGSIKIAFEQKHPAFVSLKRAHENLHRQ